MAYTTRPYVRERYEQNSRLADLMMQQGRNAANAKRQQGDISAQMWGNVGNTISNTIGQYAQGKEQEAERKARAAADAPRVEMEALKLREAQQKEGDRGTFDQAMKQHGGRAATLKALEAQPELYQRAQQHFSAMDDTLKRVWGTAAAGVRAFGDQPKAAIAALDDLVEQGFDAKRLDRFRLQIVEHPESVSQIVDQLLAESPEPAHRAMLQKPAAPKVSSVDPTHDVIDETGKLIRPGVPAAPAPMTPAQQGQQAETARHNAAMEAIGRMTAGRADAAAAETRRHNLATEATAATGRDKPTEDERKMSGFHGQMTDAMKVMDELEDKISQKELYQIQTLPQEGLVGMANRGELSEEAKRYMQAFEQFTESRLRPVSGAMITDTEFARDRRTYAKQYGETAALAAQRRASRARALESLKTRAGRALPKDETPKADDQPKRTNPFPPK